MLEELAGGGVERFGENLRAGVGFRFGEVLERRGDGEKLAERIPAQVVLLKELLNMLRRGSAGAGLEQPAAVHQRNDRKHLRARADFEDREKVGEIVAEDIARDGNGVLAFDNALKAQAASLGGRQDADVEAGGVVILQVGFDLRDELGVVAATGVEPENRGIAGGAGAAHGEFYPIADRGVLGLAGAPDITRFHAVLEKGFSFGIDEANGAVGGNLKGLVVRTVFLGGLRHEANIRHGAHGLGIECAVFAAKINHGLIDRRVATVRNHGERVLRFALGVPHLAAVANHRRHRGIDDHIARHMEVRDALVGIHHRERRARGEGGFEVAFDRGFFVSGEFFDLGQEVAEAVVEIDSELLDGGGVARDELAEENLHGMAEKNRVRDFHHRRLEVEREKHSGLLRGLDLLGEKGLERLARHEGRVQNLAGLEFQIALPNHRRTPGGGEEFNSCGRCGRKGGGFFVREKVVAAHRGHTGLRVFRPRSHLVRVLAGVVLHRLRRTAVGISLAQDGVHRAALHLVVTGLDVLLGVVGGRFGIVGNRKSPRLQLGDRCFQLRNRRADVREFDDVRLGLERQGAEFRKGVGGFLVLRQAVGKHGENAACQ